MFSFYNLPHVTVHSTLLALKAANKRQTSVQKPSFPVVVYST